MFFIKKKRNKIYINQNIQRTKCIKREIHSIELMQRKKDKIAENEETDD